MPEQTSSILYIFRKYIIKSVVWEVPMQTIYNKTLEDTLYYNDIAVFTYKIDYPFFLTACGTSAAHGINRHYEAKAEKLEHYCRTALYEEAVESARYIQKNFPPFHSL